MGRSGFTSKNWLSDVALVLASLTLWIVPLILLSHVQHDANPHIGFLLPRAPLDTAIWVALSISAGICEEFAFRGYFQKQFSALTNSRALGVTLQALLFGIAHSYEGLSASIAITVYGMILGALSLWRGNLRAAIGTHILTDLLMGVLAR